MCVGVCDDTKPLRFLYLTTLIKFLALMVCGCGEQRKPSGKTRQREKERGKEKGGDCFKFSMDPADPAVHIHDSSMCGI